MQRRSEIIRAVAEVLESRQLLSFDSTLTGAVDQAPGAGQDTQANGVFTSFWAAQTAQNSFFIENMRIGDSIGINNVRPEDLNPPAGESDVPLTQSALYQLKAGIDANGHPIVPIGSLAVREVLPMRWTNLGLR